MDLRLSSPQKDKKESQHQEKEKKSLQYRKLFIFLVFLIISMAMWLVQSLQTTYTTQISIPIEYRNWGNDYGLDDSLPEEIQVTLSDKGLRLLNYALWGTDPIVLSPNKKIGSKTAKISFSQQQLLSLIRSKVMPTSTILTISPSELVVSLYKRKKKEVVVQSLVELIPSNGYVISSSKVSPTRVTIFGDANVIRRLDKINTRSISKSDLKKSDSIRVDLRLPANVDAVPASITLVYTVEELSEEVIELPITPINVPEDYELRPLPSTISATLTLPKSLLGKIKPEDIQLVVDFSELYDLSENNREHLTIQVAQKPESIMRVQCSPTRVQFVLEHK